MLQIIIVVFREILEISLIVGILAAATKEIAGAKKWILGGLALGFVSSVILAFLTDQISETFDGLGQEIFNGIILATASIMISWTILWMQKHIKTLSSELKKLGKMVIEGRAPLYSMMLVVFFSTLREGAEVVLFTYSSYISGVLLNDILIGLIVGVMLGASFGFALYLGMLKIFGKYFFAVTTWILIFLSSGILAQAFGFWVSADMLPALANPIWDTSAILSQNSILGKFFHIFFGYIDRPMGLQVLIYFANLALLIVALRHFKKS